MTICIPVDEELFMKLRAVGIDTERTTVEVFADAMGQYFDKYIETVQELKH